MEESILNSTKKILSIDPNDTGFDHDIITHINTAFSHLQQLGIGPAIGFAIDSDEAEWADFLGDIASLPILSAVKTNVYLRVRLLFDPPQLSHVLTAMQAQLLESDVRLNLMREETAWSDPDPPAIVDTLDEESPIVDGGGA